MIYSLVLSAALLFCTATDGDTVRCGDERIRLVGIDAPEMRGRCRPGRQCVPGDPKASQRGLAEFLKSGPLTIHRLGKDRYGRTIGAVTAGGKDASCWQVTRGYAEYVPRWDNRQWVSSTCRLTVVK